MLQNKSVDGSQGGKTGTTYTNIQCIKIETNQNFVRCLKLNLAFKKILKAQGPRQYLEEPLLVKKR